MEITKRPSADFTRVFDLIRYQQGKYANPKALNQRLPEGWQGYSIGEVQARVDFITHWLVEQGLKRGDHVLLVPTAGNPYWMMLDFACQQAGVIPVPLHPTLRDTELEHIITETTPRLCVTANAPLATRHRQALQRLSVDCPVYQLEGGSDFFQPLLLPEGLNAQHQQRVNDIKALINEEDQLTLLYTSGSSGVPKGVMLSHRNVVSNIKAILTLLPLEPNHRVISFLPFSHVFERTTCYAYIAFGVSIYFNQDRDSFTGDFASVRPHFCTCVPRVLEKCMIICCRCKCNAPCSSGSW